MLLTTVKMETSNCYWDDIFNADELNEIINYCEKFEPENGVLGVESSINDSNQRLSKVAWIHRDQYNDWIFSRIEFAVNKLNARFFGFDIFRLDVLQFTLYDEEGSHYDWHWDMYDSNPIDGNLSSPQRKVSAVLQLSDPSEYEGGDLQLSPGGETKDVTKKKGYMSIFPSFVVHKVTPITSGKRKSLVAWFTGPDWR